MRATAPQSRWQREPAATIDYAIVGPRDNRVHEIHTTRYPYRTICYLARDFGGGKWLGATGVLITPQLVLTAGHCLFSHLRGRPPERIAVIPGRADRDSMPMGSFMADTFFVPSRYLGRHPSFAVYDYGIIRLKRPVETLRRFMPVRALSDSEIQRQIKQRPITIAGYPADRPIGTLWRHSEHLAKFTPWRLFYTVDTCPGHSGSPIYYFPQAGYPEIIGVHTSGIVDERGRAFGCRRGTVFAPPGMLNSGIRMTRNVVFDIFHPAQSAASARLVRIRAAPAKRR